MTAWVPTTYLQPCALPAQELLTPGAIQGRIKHLKHSTTACRVAMAQASKQGDAGVAALLQQQHLELCKETNQVLSLTMQQPELAGQQLAEACGQILELDGQVKDVQGGGEMVQQERLLLLQQRALWWKLVVQGMRGGWEER
jgi:hypothetical protein